MCTLLYLINLYHFIIKVEEIRTFHQFFDFFSTLTFLAHGSYQKPVAQNKIIPCSQSTVSRHLHEIVNIMVNHLGNRYIKFPQTVEEIITTKQGFFAKHGIPGIVGCIDCTHIKIVPSSFRQLGYPPNVFVNRKNFCSINYQLIS